VRLRGDIKSATAVLNFGDTIIDFGTGDGSLAQELSQIGYRTEARDMFPAEEWLRTGISYKQVDVSAPIPADFMVDGAPARLVIMRHVLEHSPFPVELLDTMKKAGVQYVVAIVPNVQSLFRKLTREKPIQ
jgi:2-polyprenyl-3-methyl-5-hydroxy-6-metoxy-1,4-benzoquinol methylase